MRIRFRAAANSAKTAAVSVEDALTRVRAATGLDLAGARARLGFSRGHLLEIVVLSSAFGSATDERALDAANLLVPQLVGGDAFDDWVGAVDVGPAPRGGSLRVLADGAAPPEPTLDLADIRPAVEAAIRGVTAELPDSPYHALANREEWTLLEAEPAVASDYAAQDDLVLCSTLLPEAMKCFLQGSPFSSRRFSKHGERFVYAKVDGAGRTMEARYSLRVSLEEALEAALAPPGLGCVVGAGIGVRYVYVVLALASPEPGIAVACETLLKLDVPRRAWLLPCDSEYDEEWAGVWDDSPEPPGDALH
jgi:hypothetical protein